MSDSQDVSDQLLRFQTRLAELELALARERTAWREPLDQLGQTVVENREGLRSELIELGAQLLLMRRQLTTTEAQLATRAEEGVRQRIQLEEFAEATRDATATWGRDLAEAHAELQRLQTATLARQSDLEAQLERQQEVLTEGLGAALEASSTRVDAILEIQSELASLRETQARDRGLVQEHLGSLTRWLREREATTHRRLGTQETTTRGLHAGLQTMQDSVRQDFETVTAALAQIAQQEQLLAYAIDAVQQSDVNAEIEANGWIQEQLGGLREALASLEQDATQRRTTVEALQRDHQSVAKQVETIVRMISKASGPDRRS